MKQVTAWAGFSPDTPLRPWQIERREVGPRDVSIALEFCGICHSDLHTVRNEWGGTTYPCVPGHEMVGRVSAVGSEVTRLRVGERVGVGCLVDSCGECYSCRHDMQQHCSRGATWTYNSKDPHLGGVTYGGYSSAITVTEDFVLRIPDSLDPAGAAPLLCAGVTTWSPLRRAGVGPGTRVGVVGLGGLGHMALKLAHAMGAEVILYTTSAGKTADARRLGASRIVLSGHDDQLKAEQGSLDLILDTLSVPHSLDPLLDQLRVGGSLVLLGVPPTPHPAITPGKLVNRRRNLGGSLIGGLAETQAMLNFCGEHSITAEVEVIRPEQINEAYERMLRSDVKYRFVMEVSG